MDFDMLFRCLARVKGVDKARPAQGRSQHILPNTFQS